MRTGIVGSGRGSTDSRVWRSLTAEEIERRKQESAARREKAASRAAQRRKGRRAVEAENRKCHHAIVPPSWGNPMGFYETWPSRVVLRYRGSDTCPNCLQRWLEYFRSAAKSARGEIAALKKRVAELRNGSPSTL